MFKIYADGQLLYEPAQKSDMLVVGPTCDAEAGLSGQLSFTMLPGHYLYDTIKKLKTEIVATLDEEEIFRGRILNWDIDFYKNKKVHCEGDISYLLDSMQPPHDLKLTPTAYLTWMISEHNIQVDAPKRFTIGQITIDAALTEHDFIDASFRDTRESIDSDLINVFGGFLRTRRVGAVTYLDYLKEYTETGEQALEFGSNLIDLTQSLSSDEIFTILLPTGEPVPPVMEGAPSWPLTIESVNNGSKLLENVDAVAQFGRIVKNQFFEGITDAAALKTAGEEFLEKAYKAPFNSYTIQGLDLHLLDKTIQQFKIGLLCRIRSAPHGIDLTLPIVRIAWDFDNPDATEIVIAPLVRDPSLKLTSNSGGISSTIGQVAGGKSGGRMNQLYKYYTEGENWAKIQADKISLIGDDISSMSGDITTNGSLIEQTSEYIRQHVVAKGDIMSFIQQDTSGTKIYGKNIELLGANGFQLTVGGSATTDPITGDLLLHFNESYSRIEATDSYIQQYVVQKGELMGLIRNDTSGTKIYGKNIELLGANGFQLTVGGEGELDPITGDLLLHFNESYSRIEATDSYIQQYVVVKDELMGLIRNDTSGTKIYGKNVELLGANGFQFTAGGVGELNPKTGDVQFHANKSYSRIQATDSYIQQYVVVKDELMGLIRNDTSGTKIYGKNVELLGANGFQFTAGGSAGVDPITGDVLFHLNKTYTSIQATQTDISLNYVKNGKILSAVNANAQGVQLRGDLVEITGPTGIIAEGNLAVGDLDAVNANIENLKSGITAAKLLRSTGNILADGTIRAPFLDATTSLSAGAISTDSITSLAGFFGAIDLGGTALNDLFSPIGHGHTTLGALTLSSLTVSGTTTLGVVGASSLSTTGAITSTGGAITGVTVAGTTLKQGGTALNDLFSPIGHTHTTLGALTLSSLTVSGTTTLGVVGASSLSTTGAITSTGGAITGVTVAGTTLKQGGTALNDLFLGKAAKAADSNKFNGELASKYVLYTGLDTALANYSLTDHTHAGLHTGYSAKSKSVLTNYQLTVNATGGVVTSVSGTKTSSTIYYLGKDS